MRSGIEIGRILEAMRAAGDSVTASLQADEILFMSRFLRVDPEAGIIIIGWSDSKQANTALLARRSITFHCNHQGTRYDFVATDPTEVGHQGETAIQLSFPGALLALQRRARLRVLAQPRVPLRCEVRLGPVSFDAQVVDISLDGLGVIVYDPQIRLEPGARLEKVRIIHPNRAPVTVDLEIRHVTTIVVPRTGGFAHRAGCRFLGDPKDLEDMIRLFVTELGAPGETSP